MPLFGQANTGVESYKCNECDYAQASNLRRHLKTHSGEKSNNCSQCDYASSRADTLSQHLKTVEKSKKNATNVTLLPLMQTL